MEDGTPYGTRTRVTAVKGRCPGPLDEGRPVFPPEGRNLPQAAFDRRHEAGYR
jgi:hypothetical protein